ncbi:MAG: amidohydrolase family protein [Sphingomonadales bacterium]|nr:amidohydrolase family protein [Sphingomonadales bacterium]
MLSGVWKIGGLCLALLLSGCGSKAVPPLPTAVALAVSNVTLIDPATRTVRPDSTIFIDDGRIVAITGSQDAPDYAAAEEIDGEGRFLIPGLIDMHVHMAEHPLLARFSGPLFIANGVTGVRDMSSDCWEPRGDESVCVDDMRVLSARIEAGETVGPHLLALSSDFVKGVAYREELPEGAPDFYHPETAAEARELVRFLKKRGVDFIKSYSSVPPAAYFAMMDEAKKLGLPVAGHVPRAMDVLEAAAAGHRSIEHARVLLYDCSDYGPSYRASMAAGEAPDDETRLRETLDGYNPARCKAVLDSLARFGVYYVPTHETREMDARAGEAAYRNDPRLRYIPEPLMARKWRGDLDETASVSPAVSALYDHFYRHGLTITRMAHEAGVPVMVGTDANDTMVFPGFSYHDELGHLAKAGLEPMEILRAATIVPARYLGREGEFGGIAVGMSANLVLLEADPLRDIANAAEIAAVIFSGRVFDKQAIEALKETVAAEF